MLLVLGRPGSGCSTFLKAIANKRGGFAGVNGDVSYGGIPAHEQAKNYRGEVNYNEEDDVHFPSLTVEQTLKFSLLNKTKKHNAEDIPVIINALLKMFGISHTRYTPVGDVSSPRLPEFLEPITDLVGICERRIRRRAQACFHCRDSCYKKHRRGVG